MSSEDINFTRHESPRASIVIVGWRGAPHLLTCLRSIELAAPSIPYEVVISLNAPTTELVDDLDRFVTGALVTTSEVNRGFAGACNRGATIGRGEELVFLNDDAEVLPGWLESLAVAADECPNAGAVGSLALGADGSVLSAGNIVWRDGTTSLMTPELLNAPELLEKRRQVDYCDGASLLVKGSTWRAIGGFDEDYFPAYYEDVDLCFKIARLGEAIVFEPASSIRHRQGASESLGYRHFIWAANKFRFVARWEDDLQDQLPSVGDATDQMRRAVAAASGRALPRRGRHQSIASVDGTEAAPAEHSDIDFLQRELAIREEYSHALEGEVDVLRASRDALEGQVGALVVDVGDLRDDIQERDRAMHDLRDDIQERDRAMHDLEAGLVELRTELERVSAEKVALLSSTSWRLTAPLRALSDRLWRH